MLSKTLNTETIAISKKYFEKSGRGIHFENRNRKKQWLQAILPLGDFVHFSWLPANNAKVPVLSICTLRKSSFLEWDVHVISAPSNKRSTGFINEFYKIVLMLILKRKNGKSPSLMCYGRVKKSPFSSDLLLILGREGEVRCDMNLVSLQQIRCILTVSALKHSTLETLRNGADHMVVR
ncbi:hypothetical protein DICVIV_01187 [Dictyocaulus viviparus]|uniref:Uncharacterized protein n=1 Tax=Dictyocaulus viviparus TaxID=29172 RepID=A0A0D8Y8Q8_DICVI|nr:hypothetical protein DICVIV_01187 [Dictyocaulus viviparus]